MSQERDKAIDFLRNTLQDVSDSGFDEVRWYRVIVASTFVASSLDNTALAHAFSSLVAKGYTKKTVKKLSILVRTMVDYIEQTSTVRELSVCA